MRKLFTFLAAVLLTASVFAQSPEKMSYQAVIRDASDNLVTSQQIGMQISILQGSTGGTAVYVETQESTTNANGLVSLEIGTGTVQSGDFTTIDWSNGVYFIKTETDPAGGTSYTITGVSQFLSVPYALNAKTADNGITTAQADAIVANTAKVGYTDALVSANSDVVANTAKVGITAQQASDITANNDKVGITTVQADAITANTAKVGYTDALVSANSDVVANTAKVGYTDALVSANSDVVANTAKVGITAQQASDITANNAKVGITTAQADAIVANTAKVGYTDALVSANSDVVANTAKVGITAQQASDITANNDKVGITTVQADAITANTAKVGITTAQSTKLAGIADGAQVNVQADWNQATNTADDYIKNKPTIPAAADGSETKVTAGTNVTVTGSGTTASPYVVNATGATTLTIGQSYQGGIIFWLDATGQHGLIAATADQSTGIQWYNGTFRYTGTTGDGLYAGAMNTSMTVATQMADNQTGNFAAKVCADYSVTVSGVTYGDWYLPSKYELNLLYLQKVAVGGFASAYYWSSTENDSNDAWLQYFGIGTQYYFNKSNTYYVRAVRAF